MNLPGVGSGTGKPPRISDLRQQYEELRREAEELHKENPYEVTHLCVWAENLLQLSVLKKTQKAKKDKIDEAICLLNEALELDSDYLDGHHMLGNAYATMGSLYSMSWKAQVFLDQARSCYKKACLLNPDCSKLKRSLFIAEWGCDWFGRFRLPEPHKVQELLASVPSTSATTKRGSKRHPDKKLIDLLRAKKRLRDFEKQAADLLASVSSTSSTNKGDSTDDLFANLAAKALELRAEIDSLQQARSFGASTSSSSTKLTDLLRAKKRMRDFEKQAADLLASVPSTSSTNKGDSTDDLFANLAAKALELHTKIDSLQQAMTSGPSTSSTSTEAPELPTDIQKNDSLQQTMASGPSTSSTSTEVQELLASVPSTSSTTKRGSKRHATHPDKKLIDLLRAKKRLRDFKKQAADLLASVSSSSSTDKGDSTDDLFANLAAKALELHTEIDSLQQAMTSGPSTSSTSIEDSSNDVSMEPFAMASELPTNIQKNDSLQQTMASGPSTSSTSTEDSSNDVSLELFAKAPELHTEIQKNDSLQQEQSAENNEKRRTL